MPLKPSEKEEEYFARLEAQKKKKLAEEREKSLKQKERDELKQLHWMHCPKCGSELQTITYQEVEIDRCFSCNGLWLDEGELEKISKTDAGKSSMISAVLRIFK
ncbi:MAG: zf-TFIIB domain-containing protein [Bacteroidota bacterium]|nr:zf-TFIIB domain-containing protein [Bacteroidota bacterium]